MKHRGPWRAAVVLVIAGATLLPACRRKPAEVNAITPSLEISRNRAPLGSAIEVTYTWTVEPTAKKIGPDYRAFVHFLDSHEVILFTDDHTPTPPPTSWEPGQTYTYTRTVFVPIVAYVGPVEVRMGLQPVARGERLALKGDDAGLREYRVAKMESLPQTENIFLVYKEGWHNPEAAAHNPSVEHTWTKKDALVSFKNPKKDVVVYLEADTNAKAFDQSPVLTVAVGGKTGVVVPIENSEIFLKKIRVKAADLGTEEWVDLKLSMNQSFVPKLKGVNTTDERELGLLVYHLYVGEADSLGKVSAVDAAPLPLASPAAGPKGAAPRPAAKK
ncbi:MAG TPA: hypothetical protein VJU18_04465 [Vicinamibacteria bacterium]|nr:hypothetical protein [Vicinamibacteria bacterium]